MWPARVREMIAELQADGWVSVAQHGDHRHFKHPTNPGEVTVPGNPGHEIAKGTVASIRRQAGLRGNGR